MGSLGLASRKKFFLFVYVWTIGLIIGENIQTSTGNRKHSSLETSKPDFFIKP